MEEEEVEEEEYKKDEESEEEEEAEKDNIRTTMQSSVAMQQSCSHGLWAILFIFFYLNQWE